MRCFTDEEILRGLEAVIVSRHRSQLLDVFLSAAQPPPSARFEDSWPVRHPMHCAICEKALTDAHGTAVVEIWITERQWRCAACTEARHG
jgi:hypothetical protein